MPATLRWSLSLSVVTCCFASFAAPAQDRPTVRATYEYHQLTNHPRGNIANHEGGRIGFNGTTVAYAYKKYGESEGEVWAVGFDGANPTLLDRYPKDYQGPGGRSSGMVDISMQAPYHVIHSNGMNLRVVPLDNTGKKAGPARQVFGISGSSAIRNIRMGKSPFVLLSAPSNRTDRDTEIRLEHGIHRVSLSGASPPVLTGTMVANLLGCDQYDVSFSGGGRFHFDVSLTDRVVAVLHVYPRDKKHEAARGCYLIGVDAGGRPRVIASRKGEDYKYYYTRISISPDGEKIVYVNHKDGQVVVANFGGSGARVVLRRDEEVGFPSNSAPLQLDMHGEHVLIGTNGLLIKTDGSYRQNLGNSPRSYSMMGWSAPKCYMALRPGRFVFHRTIGNKSYLATIEMNRITGDKRTPYITKYQLEPMALPAAGGEGVIARAWVPMDPSRLEGVRVSGSHNGILDKDIYFAGAKDDGNKSRGDKKGDRIYSDSRGPLPERVTGSRVVRFDVESEDEQGMRHAFAVEIGPVAIRKIPAPPDLDPSGTDVVPPKGFDGEPGGPGDAGGPQLPPDVPYRQLPPPERTGPGLPHDLPPDARRGTILQANKVRVRPGDTVRVRLYLWNARDIANMNVTLGYDRSVAVPEGKPLRGGLLAGLSFEANERASDGVRVGFADTDGISGSGSVAYVTFKAVGSPGDRTPISLSITTVNDPSGGKPSVYRIPGEILIVDENGFEPGDTNGDGEINELDALDALKMSVELIPVRRQADVDNSGDVTSRDAVLIMEAVRGAGG